MIATLPQTCLEVDNPYLNDQKSNAEFVAKPWRTLAEMAQHGRDVVGLVAAARRSFMQSGNPLVPLSSLPAVTTEGNEHQQFRLGTAAPMVKLQSTQVVALEEVDLLLKARRDPNFCRRVNDDARKVNRALSKACRGAKVPPRVAGFAKLLVYYMAEAQGKTNTLVSEKGHFHLMLRSDWRTMYRELLQPEERAMVRLLLTHDGKSEPLMLRAIGRRGNERFFSHPYRNRKDELHTGPRLQTVFDSILQGRGEGLYSKDVLSPLKGNPLHSGDLKQDYPMGAWGVNTGKRGFFVELRARTGRDPYVLLNSHYHTALKKEYKFARELCPELLGDPKEIRISSHEINWVRASHGPIVLMGELRTRLQQERESDPRQLQASLKEKNLFAVLDKFEAEFKRLQWGRRYPQLKAALGEFQRRLRRARKADAGRFTGRPFCEAFDRLFDALWDVDASVEAEEASRQAAAAWLAQHPEAPRHG